MAAVTLRDKIIALLSGGAASPSQIAVALGAVAGSVRRELVALRRAGRVLATGGVYAVPSAGAPPVEAEEFTASGLQREILAALRARYFAVVERYSELVDEKRFLRIPMAAESCLGPQQLGALLGAAGGTLRSRLSELASYGAVEVTDGCYKLPSMLGKRKSMSVYQSDGWRLRIYRDENGAEMAIVAPYGQERKRLKFDKRTEDYSLDLYPVRKSASLLPRTMEAYGNSYGAPIKVVTYPVADYTVIDVDVKRFPKVKNARPRAELLRRAAASGAVAYEDTRSGGIHIIFPSSVLVPKEFLELQDAKYEEISRKRGQYATRPYKVVRL